MRPIPQDVIDVLSASVVLLFVDGQTTERTVHEIARLGAALGYRVTLIPRWGEVTLRIEDALGESLGAHYEIIVAAPMGVEMHRVAATNGVIDDICAQRTDVAAARAALDAITRLPPISLTRFALFAAAGAAALGVIFGVVSIASLALIACSAGAGACLRRWLASRTRSPFMQPLCAALLAGAVGALAARFGLSGDIHLVAVCPCMVLVPGPHLLNGVLDFARGRIPLGAARVLFASLVIVMICVGLLAGLSAGGVTLPVDGASTEVSLVFDVLAAGVAVAAYGAFFAMPWRMLPIPIVIGMAAHACRWAVISIGGGSVEIGALVACLIVGLVVTPIANRLQLPFAAFAFASVVSLIPGVFLFRMASGLTELVSLGGHASTDLLLGTIGDGVTAILIILAMAFGLIVPKLCIEHFRGSVS